MVHHPSVVCHPSTIFKDLLLQNSWADRSQISYGASVGWGNENLFLGSGSHDQDGHHAHIYMVLTLQKSSSPESKGQWLCGLVCSIGPIIVCSNDDPRVTLICFMARSNFVSYAFIWGKLLESHLMEESLQQMTRVTKGLCLYKNSDPKGLSGPAPGLYTCIKTWKIMYKIRLQRYFFETCNKWAKWQGFSVDIRILSAKGCLPLPRGYIHVEKH